MSTAKTKTQNIEKTAILATEEDMKSALLVVSLAINMFVFTAWLVTQVS